MTETARFAAMNDQTLRRIGADLHDGPAQQMGFAALRLDALRQAVGPKGSASVDEVARAVKDAISEIRTISRGLYPVALEFGGLPAALVEAAAMALPGWPVQAARWAEVLEKARAAGLLLMPAGKARHIIRLLAPLTAEADVLERMIGRTR